jgi:methyl halide transferase
LTFDALFDFFITTTTTPPIIQIKNQKTNSRNSKSKIQIMLGMTAEMAVRNRTIFALCSSQQRFDWLIQLPPGCLARRKMSSKGNGNENQMSNEQLVRQMRQRFAGEIDSPQFQGKVWDSLWESGTTPWDLGKATPLLISEVNRYCDDSKLRFLEHDHCAETAREHTKMFRTLVPGCGAGYDLVALALHHEAWISKMKSFRNDGGSIDSVHSAVVVGLDVSEASIVKHAAPFVTSALQNHPMATTRVDLVHGDFFASRSIPRDDDQATDHPWNVLCTFGGQQTSISEASPIDCTDSSDQFDFIFDYTFFCALPPLLRADWGSRMASLLRPDTGRLLTIMFPVDADTNLAQETGPPYSVTIDAYREALEPHGVFMREDYGGPRASPASVPARAGKELVCWWSRRSQHKEEAVSRL